MPSSLEKWQEERKILLPRYDGVQVDNKGKSAEHLDVKELTANRKILNRTLLIPNRL
jgi:hypothetical protein